MQYVSISSDSDESRQKDSEYERMIRIKKVLRLLVKLEEIMTAYIGLYTVYYE